MSMTKAATIVGIFIVIIAIVVFILCFKFIGIGDKEPTPSPSQTIVENVETSSPNPNVTEPTQSIETVEPTQPVETVEPIVTEKIITKEVSGVKTIDENSLGEALEEKEVIVRISNKRVILVDEKVEGTDPKMLTYCFDVAAPDDMNLTLFVTNSVYTTYNVGDLLKVTYQVYTNDKGILFPLVQNVLNVD